MATKCGCILAVALALGCGSKNDFPMSPVSTLSPRGRWNTMSGPFTKTSAVGERPQDTSRYAITPTPTVNFALESSSTSAALNMVWGTDSSNIYAVGEQGTVLHSDGQGHWTVLMANQP